MHWAPSGSIGEELILWKSPSTSQKTIDAVMKNVLAAIEDHENQGRVLESLRALGKRGSEIFHDPELFNKWLQAYEDREEEEISRLKSASQVTNLPINDRARAILEFENASRGYTQWLKNLTELHAKAMNNEDLFNAVSAIA